MRVLSLFDGISAGHVALDRAGIQVDTYFASEIDKWAIGITKYQYPDTVHVGDVQDWRSWQFLGKIDLILAGSPCQGFSKAGEGLNFDDPRSKLFFEFVDILNWVREHNNPDVKFLLENVEMRQEWVDIITEYMGVEPVFINSKLVSAQSRPRWYWTNIGEINQPEDRGIFLKDIILPDARIPALHHMHGRWGETDPRVYFDKSPVIRPYTGGGHIPYLIISEREMEYMFRTVKDGRNHWDFNHHSDIRKDKSSAVVANFRKGVPYNVLITEKCTRKFDPIECERLQTFEDGYTEHYIDNKGRVKDTSNTQRYNTLGNSWTVEVIVHILESTAWQ